ncbi:hypothetical protein PINS_up008492 [Pythium insidiosum]|nr:hypothetical protein PINS_up008492 [Pythium insidiosum]
MARIEQQHSNDNTNSNTNTETTPMTLSAPVASKPNKSNKKNRKAAVDANKTDADANKADADAAAAAAVDHPYLSFLYKRIRLYKKKLEKIKTLEVAQQSEGKVLNDQQLELVGSRSLVEKMLVEMEALREQFVGVYLVEQAAKQAAVESEPTQPEESPSAEPAAPVAEAVPTAHEYAHVEDLLRTLHAVTLHQALGKDVPMVLDYFSKVLLGKTRPPAEVSFEDNLAESMEEAKRYLSCSDKVMACDTTYRDLRAVIDALSASLSATQAVDAVEAEKGPEINFFTDSHIVSPSGDSTPTIVEVESPIPGEEAHVPPSPPAELVPRPPKSFSSGPTSPSVGSSDDVDSPQHTTEQQDDQQQRTQQQDDQQQQQQQQQQRRRFQGRWKTNTKLQYRVKQSSDSSSISDRPRSASGRKDDSRRPPPRAFRDQAREDGGSRVAPATA